jgi:hypothetical protein
MIDLATNHPDLKPVVGKLIQDWDSLESDADKILYVAEFRKDRLRHESDDETDLADADIPQAVKSQADVMHQIRCLERLLTPDSEDDPVWHHPLEYVEERAEQRHVLFVEPAIAVFRGEEFSNGQKFEFMLMERVADRGFRHWLYPEPQTHLRHTHEWLKEIGDSRSLKDLVEPLQTFLASRRGRAKGSLRDFLTFPATREPTDVTHEIRYWNEVAELSKRGSAEVRLYMAQNDNERTAALKWMRASDDNKFLVIGDDGAFQGFSFSRGCTTRETSFLVHHRIAKPSYEWHQGKLSLYRALNYVAFEVGRKRGRGIHQSTVLPIKDNQHFLEAFVSGEMQDAATALYAQFVVTTSGGYVDAAIFTAEEDHVEDDSCLEPNEVDVSKPLSGMRV